MNHKLLSVLFLLCFATVWCKKIAQTDSVPQGGMAMFEISTRPWLYLLTQKYGRPITQLADIPIEEFQQIANQGFDIVWMMGVWSLGAYGLNHDKTDPGLLAQYKSELPSFTLDDVIGSPYAVTDYVCNPQLGNDTDILNLKARLNSVGLKLMLDFVPNHSAVDCAWVDSNPDFYIRSPKGTQPPYDSTKYLSNGIAYGSACYGCGSWTDTAQFNYWNPTLAKARTQQLLHVASLADAIRCDMAYLLLNDVFQQTWGDELQSWGWVRPNHEWWQDSISTVKAQYPNIIFLAEVYDKWMFPLQSYGFDYTYDKTLYDKIASNNLDSIRQWLASNSPDFIRHSAHFIANHDEPRAAKFFGSWWKADAVALLMFTLPGLRFHWMGNFEGYANRLDVHLRRQEPEATVQDSIYFYQNFLNITNSDVFKKGQWTYLDLTQNNQSTDSTWRLIAYRWEYNDQKILCVINYSDDSGSARVLLPNAQARNGNDMIPVTDLLSGSVYQRSASDMRNNGLFVVVNSWYAQIFSY